MKEKIDVVHPEEYKDIVLDYSQKDNVKMYMMGKWVKITIKYPSGRNYTARLERDEWDNFFKKVLKVQLVIERRDEHKRKVK